MPAGVQESPCWIVRQMLQTHGNVIVRQPRTGALRPLDQLERLLGHDLVPADVREILWLVEPVQIEMIHGRRTAGVAMNEGERWAGDVVLDAVAATDRLHERGLAGAELARDCDDERRARRAAELFSPGNQLELVECQPTVTCQRGNYVISHGRSASGVRRAGTNTYRAVRADPATGFFPAASRRARTSNS